MVAPEHISLEIREEMPSQRENMVDSSSRPLSAVEVYVLEMPGLVWEPRHAKLCAASLNCSLTLDKFTAWKVQ